MTNQIYNNNNERNNHNPNPNHEWDFFFGRGGSSNIRRQSSRANHLVQALATRYSACRQTEKRLFAKAEVYDRVVRNGGTFYLVANKEVTDVTDDVDKVIGRIMQMFRDSNKSGRLTATSTSTDTLSLTNHKLAPKLVGTQTQPKHKQRMLPVVERPYTAPSCRPKRRCIRPSIIEPPIIKCERGALRVLDTDRSISEGKTTSCTGKMNIACDDGHESFYNTGMKDKIKTHLPADSHPSVNLILQSRVSRLENLVAMLMRQKNEDKMVDEDTNDDHNIII